MADRPMDVLLGKGESRVYLLAKYGNRHGLTAGATGTGKTVSLMLIAEGFSRLGVPVFIADVKGDVAGLATPGTQNDHITTRVTAIGIDDYRPEANPVAFWDVYGTGGHPLRTTVSEMGPTLLGRMLELNDTQTGVLEIASSSPTTAACCCSTSTTFVRCWPLSGTTARTCRHTMGSPARNRSPRFNGRCLP